MSEQQPTPETDAEHQRQCDMGWQPINMIADWYSHARRLEQERDEARKLAEDMHQFDPQQRNLPWVRPSTAQEKLDLAVKALQKIDQVGGAMRGEWASEKAAETLKQIQ